ncbi:MAG: DUF58 domain-containing protein [Firmicutes bacterium]|nr:DUF58 domain-containing protein [Bacillota bacterium]
MRENRLWGVGAELFLLLLAVFGESAVPVIAMIAVPLVSGISLLLVKFYGKNLSLSLSMQDLAEPGDSLSGQIKVTNEGKYPFSLVRVEIETKNLLTGEGSLDAIPISIGAKNESIAEIEVACSRCGRVRVAVTDVRLYDLFGFFSVSLLCEAKTKALILPDIFPMEVTVGKSNTAEPECDTYSPYKAGNDPAETFEIRDYEPGDPLRSIHWKLTGKFDRLMIREAGLPVNESILILFERICPDGATLASPAVRAALGEIVVSLSQSLTERNIAHTVGWLRSENGTFLGHRVDSEESFQLIMAEVLSVYEMYGEEDTIESYLKTNDIHTYSNIVYISARDSERFSLIPDQIGKTMILCSDHGIVGSDEHSVYAVTPMDHAESLYQVLI